VRPGNQPPVPVIEVSPLVQFAGATNRLVIAPNNTNALVAFDGSKSQDPDDRVFHYCWQEGTNVFATNAVGTRVLALGAHPITLRLDDTFPLGTNSALAEVKIITPAESVALLAGMMAAANQGQQAADAGGTDRQPLIALLEAAAAAFDRGGFAAGRNQLGAFQNMVRAQVAPEDPGQADQLILAAQEIIDRLSGSSGRVPAKITKIARQASGRVQMQFTAKRGQVCVIEVSGDLVQWEPLGMAEDKGSGWFEFEDVGAGQTPTRFYRIVSP
jgi:hypothetical protein